MRCALAGLFLVAAGCGSGDTDAVDAAVGVDASDAAIDAPPIDGAVAGPIRACPVSSDLVACYLFDNNGIDNSANANNTVAVGVEFTDGVANRAAVFTDNDQMTVVEDGQTFEVVAVTIEAWLRPSAFPDGGDVRAGVFDKNGQYSFFIDPTGAVFCNGAGGVLAPAGQLTIGTWSHVACSMRDDDGKRVYVDRTEVAAIPPPINPLSTGVGDPAEIGSDGPFTIDDSHYEGAIDNLLIWSTVRTRDQLCETSGLDCQ